MTNSRNHAHELARLLFDEAVNNGRVELISELYHTDFIDHAPGPGQSPGAAGIVQVVERYRDAIPDLHVTVEEVLVDGDAVITRETWRGEQKKHLAGVTPSGAPFETTRMHVFKLREGRIIGEWTAGDVICHLRFASGA